MGGSRIAVFLRQSDRILYSVAFVCSKLKVHISPSPKWTEVTYTTRKCCILAFFADPRVCDKTVHKDICEGSQRCICTPRKAANAIKNETENEIPKVQIW